MNICADSFSSNSNTICSTCQKVIRNQEIDSVLTSSLHLGPSTFIPEEEIIGAASMDTSCGGLDLIAQVMSLYPHYLQSFLRSQFYLLQVDGPLPLHWRHYIAIMAAARHQCAFLVKMHMQEFYQMGVCMEWLKGLQYAPQRLRNLNEINKILAHRPWLITKEHIENLVQTGEHSWTLAELVHAIVLLAHFHALASFVFGSGINTQEDSDDMADFGGCCTCDLADESGFEPGSVLSSMIPGTTDSLSELEILMERMTRLQEADQKDDASQEDMATRFEKEKKESLLVDSDGFRVDVVSTSPVYRFVEDASFGYQGFARRGDCDSPTLCAQDYSWEDHGFSVINRLYSDLGLVLDEKFRTACSLTYYTMANREGIDTSMLRQALFNYVHCMYGIRYDDYDYRQVNQLLERSLKRYIKTVTCYPERMTRSLYDAYWKQFHHSEKVHVTLLLMEARMQAELLYALRAITSYMT